SDGAAQLRVGNAHDLKLWARRGKDRTQRVEDRGYLQRAANGHDVRDRWVVRRCVEKGKAGFLELAHSTINVQIQWNVESFESIRRAGLRGNRSVSAFHNLRSPSAKNE